MIFEFLPPTPVVVALELLLQLHCRVLRCTNQLNQWEAANKGHGSIPLRPQAHRKSAPVLSVLSPLAQYNELN